MWKRWWCSQVKRWCCGGGGYYIGGSGGGGRFYRESGRAAGRERGWGKVEVSVVAVTLKEKGGRY
jgi:hypothetical protein